jgi:hypothetical protein
MRRAAGWAATPAPPAWGVRPLEPRFDAPIWQMSGAHAFGMLSSNPWPDWLSIPEACTDGLTRRLTPDAGGLGGGAPTQRGARGAEPARILAQRTAPVSGEREGSGPWPPGIPTDLAPAAHPTASSSPSHHSRPSARRSCRSRSERSTCRSREPACRWRVCPGIRPSACRQR